MSIENNKTDNSTLDYYNKFSKEFTENTFNVDFNTIQQSFIKYLKPKANILDLGCGSGRDTLKFKQMGFNVFPVDGSIECCKITEINTKIKTRHLMFSQLSDIDLYDGVWACASILHVTKKDLPSIINKIYYALKNNGIFYCSFKYGEFEGYRNSRYFSDFTENTFKSMLEKTKPFEIIEQKITRDVRPGRENEKWLNLILKKKNE